MIKLLKAYYALKALISLQNKLKQFGWESVKKGRLQSNGYQTYMKNIGIRLFFVEVPKDIFSETFKDDLQKCLKSIWECMTFNTIRDGLIDGFIQHAESDGFFDRMFERHVKEHPFNLDDFKTKQGKE